MNEEIRVELELEDIRRKMTACMNEMTAFMKRVKVERVHYRSNGKTDDVLSVQKAKRTLEVVAEQFSMSVSRVISRDRETSVVVARQVAHYIMRQVTSLSTTDIAELTGIRHHTTVIHSTSKVEEMRRADPKFDVKVREMISLVIGDNQCPRCEMAKHRGQCAGATKDPSLRADQELERVRELQ